ncbi:MAG: 23S rRNA (pseudouridine(1915)-N(3))-methyltransferase RlmH [Candidatus Gracilibacteria bacterium]|jgi:23S rRNA (pseudouridine1915-N3)-methyltransferase
MKIRILQVGKNKDAYISDVSAEFIKRISPYAKVEVLEVGEDSLKKIDEKDFLIVMDERGEEMDSVKFSKFISERKDDGDSLCFVIGGPFGLSDEIKAKAKKIISMSKMTFTHQMIRIFLLEQIYRAFSIIHDKGYHH